MDNSMNMEWLNTNNDIVNALIQLSELPKDQDHRRESQTKVSFEPAISVVQSNDRFVNMSIENPPAPKAKPPNKKRFQEPVFVTESPEKAYKKKSDLISSSDSEDEQTGKQPTKAMTSKERRQIRNKISARNFRVRRKEYITQLEQTLDEHEKTIRSLKEENTKLRKANEDLMQQFLSQPPIVNSGTSDEAISSSSEGQSSPEPLSNLPFQFPMNDLYDLGLFDQPEQPPAFSIEPFNSLFFNHAVMPNWDLHKLISDKIKPTMKQDEKRKAAEEILSEYPLLGAALMSIVLRHTMTLEYITSMANTSPGELIKKDAKEKNESGSADVKSKNMPLIEAPSKPEEPENNEISDEELITYVLTHHYKYYAFARARGINHPQIMANWRGFVTNHEPCKEDFYKRMRNKDFHKPSGSKPGKFQTLQAYCKVAGTILKRPQRMAHINKVLKETMSFPQNEHTQRVEQQYVSMMSRTSKLRISTN